MVEKIAIFGGSFNPPHIGHLMMCQYVLATRPDISTIYIIPTYRHPFDKKLIDFEHRASMCDCVGAYFDHYKVRTSRVEQVLGGVSYTINTLKYFKDSRDCQLALIVGSDLVSNPDEWKDFDEVKKLAELIIIRRFGWGSGQGPAFMDISSTVVRKRLKYGESIEGWVPSNVLEYIKSHNIKFE